MISLTDLSSSKTSDEPKLNDDKSDRWTRARLIEELLIWFRSIDIQIDERTGHKRSKYERQAEFVMYRIAFYRPPPTFVVNVSDFDLQDNINTYEPIDTLRTELLSLDEETLEDVMTETISRLYENVNDRYYRLSIKRKDIKWVFQK